MTKENSWNTLRLILDLGGDFFVKKCGLANRKGLIWSLSEEELNVLAENGFSRASWQQIIFLESDPSASQSASHDWVGQLKNLISWCLFKEQRQLIPFIQSLINIPTSLGTHQAGFISNYLRFLHALRRVPANTKCLEPETVISISQSTSLKIDETCRLEKSSIRAGLREYVQGTRPRLSDPTDRQLLSSLVALNQVPLLTKTGTPVITTPAIPENPFKLISQLKKSPTPASLYRLIK